MNHSVNSSIAVNWPQSDKSGKKEGRSHISTPMAINESDSYSFLQKPGISLYNNVAQHTVFPPMR